MDYAKSLIKFIDDYTFRHKRVKIYKNKSTVYSLNEEKLSDAQLEWIMAIIDDIGRFDVDKDIVEVKIDPYEMSIIILIMEHGKLKIISSKGNKND